MQPPQRRRITAVLLGAALLAGTAGVAPAAHAEVPTDPAGLANTLFGSHMRIADRDDGLARHLVASAELADWRARNPQADGNAVSAHFTAVRAHLDAAVPDRTWARDSHEAVGAALNAARTAPGAATGGPQITTLNTAMLGLNVVPVSGKPEDRVSGAQPQFAWRQDYAVAQAQVWGGVAATARADNAFRTAWNAGLGSSLKVDAGADATELGNSEKLRTVLDVPKILAAGKIGPVEFQDEATSQFRDLTTKLYNQRKLWTEELGRAARENPPDVTPREPTEAQKETARAEEAKRQDFIDGAEAGLNAMAWLVGRVNADLSRQISKFTVGAVQVAAAVNKAITAFRVINSVFSLATVAFTGNVIGAISTLVSVFGGGGPDVNQLILGEIKAMREQLAAIQQNMNERFDKVDAKLNLIYDRMLGEFKRLENGVAYVRANTEAILTVLTSLSAQNQIIGSTLLKAVAGLYELNKWEMVDATIDYKRKRGGEQLPHAKFTDAESAFYTMGVQAPTNNLFVVPQANYSTVPAKVAENLNLHGEGGIADYLAWYAANAGLDPGFSAPAGGNAAVWGIGATAYSLLRAQNPAYRIEEDRGRVLLDKGKNIRDQALAFSRPGVNGTTNTLFTNLLENYRRRYESLLAEAPSREADVKGGKDFHLWRGADQGTPNPALAPATLEGCNPHATRFSLSRPGNLDGRHLRPGFQFLRHVFDSPYRQCWRVQGVGVPGRPGAVGLHVVIEDYLHLPGDAEQVSVRTTSAVVHEFPSQPPGDGLWTYLRDNWDARLRAVFERIGRDETFIDVQPRAIAKGNEFLKNKRTDYYGKVAQYLNNGNRAFETNLAAQLIRRYTELGFPQALNTDEYLRGLLRGGKQLYGVNAENSEYLAYEFQLAARNNHEGRPAWDPARSDAPSLCANIAAMGNSDPVVACMIEQFKQRKDRLAARFAEQFKQRWEGVDQTLPGIQGQLRSLWLAMKELHPDHNYGPPITGPEAQAPASAIWSTPVSVDAAAAYWPKPAITTFRGGRFAAWTGDEGHIYGSVSDGRGWAPKVKIAEGSSRTSSVPTAVEFNGKLVVVWRSLTRGTVLTEHRAMSADGRDWAITSTSELPNPVRHHESPALTVFNGKLYALHIGTDQKQYLSTSADGLVWTPATVTLPGHQTNQSPALTVFNGKLHAAWKAFNSSWMFVASSPDGVTWTLIGRVAPDGGTDNSPALAATGGKLYAAWRGIGSDPNLYGSYSSDGASWAPQHYVARGSRTDRGPGLTAADGRLDVVWSPQQAAGPAHLGTASSMVAPK
ncbi:hypothetical protein [Crossiella cryophila]|uniref:Uncharacterized protein n=1 Tax=Crossiella cryophila TaxID=43355 RepID=A0A7W7CAX6_9PSEU|nr:hypothetical protein [Crossiella cryophila]MBB4677774.1 hypothetical protein [Crossiella cryophila]